MPSGFPVSLGAVSRRLAAGCTVGAVSVVLGCGGSPSSDLPASDSAPAHASAAAAGAGSMEEMFHGLMGGCAVLASESGSPSIEIVIDESAAASPASITIQADSTSSRELTAELSGSGMRVGCGGVAPMIRFGGTSMMIGTPTLRVTTSTPVSVSVRTTTARTVAGPVTVQPGTPPPSLRWGQ